MKKILILQIFIHFCFFAFAAVPEFGFVVKDGMISYQPDQSGNRIIDFSYCGYNHSETEIPVAKNKIFVPAQTGDASAVIQRAIDYVSGLRLQENGLRGAVVLSGDTFYLDNPLKINASGVIIRGAKSTTLIKRGVDRGAVIYIGGKPDIRAVSESEIADEYVPVGSMQIGLKSAETLAKGDQVLVFRPSTKQWIESLGCAEFGGGISALGWKPGDADYYWNRKVVAVEGDVVFLDAPVPLALKREAGQCKVLKIEWPGRISDCGVENITLISDYDKKYPKDEDHAWTGISISDANNCWVQSVNFLHFAGSVVILQPSASSITVQDCISKMPASEIGGMRRTTFLNMGQLNLFQRCYAEDGIHDFAVAGAAPGPNAFVQCTALRANGFSGSVDILSPGLLYDVVNIDGHNLSFKNLGQAKNGAGWNTANSLFWQCTAAEIECFSPTEDAPNRAYGCWAQFSGNGRWAESNNHVQPRSLFYAQLQNRLQKNVSNQAQILPLNTNATSSPTVEAALELAQEAKLPLLTLDQWILKIQSETPDYADAPFTIGQISKFDCNTNVPGDTFSISEGKLLYGLKLAAGYKIDVNWWSGKLRNPAVLKAKPHITRFVPGREGFGLTDNIDELFSQMQANNILTIDHNYGLWYDRRRDDHQRIRRHDGDVWGPFYEQPFARSGEGMAWDGLSKYDLTRPNKWYWSRLKEYADKAEGMGMLLYHQHFFQHNIIEAGAHWVDCPWRTANNINNTGFPEPVNFAGDKRVFMADIFYDLSNPVRNELYRNYIRQCLNNFRDNKNVIHFISAEYTGPLHFVQFWLNEIASWEKETGKDAIVALSATKDVQDAILGDPSFANIVDVIDIRYWHYKDDGSLYEPAGGLSLAPRQHARLQKAGKTGYNEVYRAVKEYKDRFPSKIVIYNAQGSTEYARAVQFAGGSCPALK